MSVLRRLGLLVERFTGVFEVPEVARYVTLPGVPHGFTIPEGAAGLSDRHFTGVDVPGLLPGSPAVLFLRTSNGGESRFSVRINQSPLIRQQLTGSEPSPLTWHVLVPAGALRPDANELVFGVPTGGSVHFSDVVILYRSNQLTVKRSIVEPPIANP